MINETVTIVNSISKRDYTNEGHVNRLKFVGNRGVVIKEHNSHGLCYDVKFKSGIATYDPDEMLYEK